MQKKKSLLESESVYIIQEDDIYIHNDIKFLLLQKYNAIKHLKK